MYITFSNTVNTCYGHVSFDDAPRVADALSDLIDRAPTGAIARRLYLRNFGSRSNAGRYVGRAWRRLGALSEALEARRGSPMSHEFGEATKGATLLIAADLVAAMLVDQSKETRDKVVSMIAITFPEMGETDLYRDFECAVTGSRQDADAIVAISGKAFEREFPAIASWYKRRIATPVAPVSDPAGLLDDAAIARFQLLAPLQGTELLNFSDKFSARALHAGLIATIIGVQMTQRQFTPHRAPYAA
ncbi:MAG: hypothetical protein EOO23_02540 [Comamonadaceae bacterium]|nr:MAG: hypothetical protein EOO23_02540 [Comamonadaceae bacterium]